MIKRVLIRLAAMFVCSSLRSKTSLGNQSKNFKSLFVQFDHRAVSKQTALYHMFFEVLAAFANWQCGLLSFRHILADGLIRQFLSSNIFSRPRYVINPCRLVSDKLKKRHKIDAQALQGGLKSINYIIQVLSPFDFEWKIGDFKQLNLFAYKIKFVDALL